jgi:hypothetical protein
MLHVFGVAGVVISWVSNQHRDLYDALEPAACRAEHFGDVAQRMSNLFDRGVAAIDPSGGIMRSRGSRDEYETGGFGGAAIGTTRARFWRADKINHVVCSLYDVALTSSH